MDAHGMDPCSDTLTYAREQRAPCAVCSHTHVRHEPRGGDCAATAKKAPDVSSHAANRAVARRACLRSVARRLLFPHHASLAHFVLKNSSPPQCLRVPSTAVGDPKQCLADPPPPPPSQPSPYHIAPSVASS